jgi:DNA end-binding protein Ku
MAQQLIESLSTDFEPGKFKDEYRERVLELIERKAAGEEIAVQPVAEEPAAAPDLMAALEASLAAVRGEEEEAPAKRTRKGAEEEAGNGSGGKRPAKAKAKAKT